MVTIACFTEGQGIHISPEGNTAGAIATLQNANDAGATNFLMYLEAKGCEQRGNNPCCSLLLKAKFGMAVKIMPPCGHLYL
jgi:pyrimidine deaminase RibD-like protein